MLAFWVTIPLPRIDGHLIGSDGIGYYAYLPSVILNRSLDFTEAFATFYAYATDNEGNNPRLEYQSETGLLTNQWSPGPALLWLPFFLIAHLIAGGLASMGISVATDGMSYLYQTIVLSGSILYGGMAVWYAYRFALLWASQGAALWAAVTVVVAGNLIYYMSAEPSMSHTVSALASSMFCLKWVSTRERHAGVAPFHLGLLAGLMALIRPQDGLMLVLPLTDAMLRTWRAIVNRSAAAFLAEVRYVGIIGIASLSVFSLQLYVWQVFTGSLLRSTYTASGQSFNFLQPKIWEVLVSSERGLLTWHPIFALAIVGLFMLARYEARTATQFLLALGIQVYLVASWWVWTQGDAFGGRMLIVCTPIFVVGVAVLIDWLNQNGWMRFAYASLGVLVASNFLLYVSYRFHLVYLDRHVSWSDLLEGRVLVPIRLLWRAVF